MLQPRKHHYLPQFYLRAFSTNGKSIYQIEKHSSLGYPCSIRDAAAIRDYHKLDYSNVEDAYAVEKRLAKIEEHHSDALRQVINDGIISAEVYPRLIEFVSFMRFRVPAVKAYIEELLRQVVRSTEMILEREGKLPPVPEGSEDVLRIDQDISNWKCLEYMFDLATDSKILEILASMRLSVLSVPEGALFLTCDQPVAVYHPEASQDDPYGTGIIDKRTEISFPLSSQVLLQLCWDKSTPEKRLLSQAEVDEFNRRTIIMADSLIFAPEQSESAVAVVARHGKYSAGIDLQVINTDTGAWHRSRFRPVMSVEQYEPSA